MEHRSAGTNKKKIWIAAASVFLLIAVIAIAIVTRNVWVHAKANSEYAEIASQVNASQLAQSEPAETPEPTEEPREYTLEEKIQLLEEKYQIDIPEKNLDFTDLQTNTNEHIYAWITVPGTPIDYPVLQHPTEEEYYLMRNLDKSYGYPGSIFSQTMNSKDFNDRVTVLYGHDISTGKMFGTIWKFADKDYFDEHRYIIIYLPDDIKLYEIASYYIGTNDHLMYSYDWSRDDIFLNFMNAAVGERNGEGQRLENYQFDVSDHVLILSTCVRYKPQLRRLVVGVELTDAY